MIRFLVSAPSRLSLLGEHAVNHGKLGLTAAIDLRTMLIFSQLPISNNILQISCLEINLLLVVDLEEYLKFYEKCVKDMKDLLNQVKNFTDTLNVSANHKIIVQAFFYLLVLVKNEKQIEIKSFAVHLTTAFMLDEEIACPASFTVCLAACFLHWSRMQRNVHHTEVLDRTEIESYATRFEEICSESGKVDVTACTHGAIVKYQLGQPMHLSTLFQIPCLPILLVDSKGTQNLEAQMQRVRKLRNNSPKEIDPIFSIINIQTILAYSAFKRILDLFNLKCCSRQSFMNQNEILKNAICTNQHLLQALTVSHSDLDKICLIAQKHGMCAKYTDIGNGRYAYIWCPQHAQYNNKKCKHGNKIFVSKMLELGYSVTRTNLARRGVTIELN